MNIWDPNVLCTITAISVVSGLGLSVVPICRMGKFCRSPTSQAPSKSTLLIVKTVYMYLEVATQGSENPGRFPERLPPPCSRISSDPMNAIPGFIRKAGQKSRPCPLCVELWTDYKSSPKMRSLITPETIAATSGASTDSTFHSH